MRTRALCALSVVALLSACGDDDGGGDTDSGTGGGAAGTSASGSGGGGSGGSSGSGGTGTAGTGGMVMLTCDDTVPTTATCGGTACPAVEGILAMTCVVPCCVDDLCGTANTSTEMPRACSVSPTPDPSCPAFDIMGLLELPGCCTADNVCGVISSRSNTCITESDVIDLPADPPACGADDGGLDDGG